MKKERSAAVVGRTLGNYRVIEKLGEGGMGVVYRAHDGETRAERIEKASLPGDQMLQVQPFERLDDPT